MLQWSHSLLVIVLLCLAGLGVFKREYTVEMVLVVIGNYRPYLYTCTVASS